MSAHEQAVGKTDEWYTPAYVFKAMDVMFDLDVAAPSHSQSIPAYRWVSETIIANSLSHKWRGSVWMNPPFGKRNGLARRGSTSSSPMATA
jgi:hypothetical protein